MRTHTKAIKNTCIFHVAAAAEERIACKNRTRRYAGAGPGIYDPEMGLELTSCGCVRLGKTCIRIASRHTVAISGRGGEKFIIEWETTADTINRMLLLVSA